MQENNSKHDPLSVAYRIEQCKACSNLSVLNICKECGCFMPAKVRLKWSSCPIGKWVAVTPPPKPGK